MATELSSDLVEEILSRVPVTSLARLMYTCKQWETLIADPTFVKKYSSRMRGREQQFTVVNNLCYISKARVSPSLSSKVSCVGGDFDELNKPGLNVHDFKPVSSRDLSVINIYHCDGLLLYVTKDRLLVLNPLLKQQERWVNCGYRFEHSINVYGLGYISNQSSSSSSSSCNDYRMVRFRSASYNYGSFGNSRVEVYGFKSDCWKVVSDQSFDGFEGLPLSSACLRGTPYWIGYNKYFGQPFLIKSFDFSKERFEALLLPPGSIWFSKKDDYLSLGIFRADHLSLLHQSRSTSTCIHIWVMMKERQHWSKLMTVDIPYFPMIQFNKISSYYIETNGKLVLSVRRRGTGSISIYVVGEDQDCQKVEYGTRETLIICGCYYVPSLLQVPGFSS